MLLLNCVLIASASRVGDVFEVHGCEEQDRDGKPYEELLDSYWVDSDKLVKHVLEGVEKYADADDHGRIVRQNLKAFFGIRWNHRRQPADESQRTILEGIIGKHV